MNRLDAYCKILEDIYGKKIVKSFTTRNDNSQTLTMNNESHNQKSKKGEVILTKISNEPF